MKEDTRSFDYGNTILLILASERCKQSEVSLWEVQVHAGSDAATPTKTPTSACMKTL